MNINRNDKEPERAYHTKSYIPVVNGFILYSFSRFYYLFAFITYLIVHKNIIALLKC